LKKILSFVSQTVYNKVKWFIKGNASANGHILHQGINRTPFIIEKWLALSIANNGSVFFLDKNDFIC